MGILRSQLGALGAALSLSVLGMFVGCNGPDEEGTCPDDTTTGARFASTTKGGSGGRSGAGPGGYSGGGKPSVMGQGGVAITPLAQTGVSGAVAAAGAIPSMEGEVGLGGAPMGGKSSAAVGGTTASGARPSTGGTSSNSSSARGGAATGGTSTTSTTQTGGTAIGSSNGSGGNTSPGSTLSAGSGSATAGQSANAGFAGQNTAGDAPTAGRSGSAGSLGTAGAGAGRGGGGGTAGSGTAGFFSAGMGGVAGGGTAGTSGDQAGTAGVAGATLLGVEMLELLTTALAGTGDRQTTCIQCAIERCYSVKVQPTSTPTPVLGANSCEAFTDNATVGAGAGTPKKRLCLDTLACLLDPTRTEADRCLKTKKALPCFCGTASGAVCVTSPNGPCLDIEAKGLEVPIATPMDYTLAATNFEDATRASGPANAFVRCLLQNSTSASAPGCSNECGL